VITVKKKVLFIVNKRSGLGFQASVEDRMLNVCNKNDAIGSIAYTQAIGHATALANEASVNNFDYVIAVGGDGTINEVAQGLIHSNTAMGILPRGSGNGLARHLGIPLNLAEAIDQLFFNKVIRMDTLFVNERLSLNVSGIGFDGHVANLFATTKIRGLVGYVVLAVKEYIKFRQFKAEVFLGEKKIVRSAFIIALANSTQYGNDIRIAPLASVSDGLLNISIMKKVPLYRLDFAYSFLRGQIKESDMIESIETSKVMVKTSTPVPFHVDGESCGLHDTFNIQVNPASLSVLVPQATEK
jgi:YegS/Rv2252/BmrU family lipid kinase